MSPFREEVIQAIEALTEAHLSGDQAKIEKARAEYTGALMQEPVLASILEFRAGRRERALERMRRKLREKLSL